MLTQIDVISDDPIELPILGVTPKHSFLIQKVTGLNPPDRSLFIGDYSQDGGLYQGRRVGSRNVVVTINLNPNPALGETVASLRESLYKAFIDPQVDGDYLKIVLTDETNREVYLVGYCDKFESDIFGSDTLCQISMICPDPYLRNNEDTILTQPSNGWNLVPFTYQGTAETGFIVRIYVSIATTDITLSNNSKAMMLYNSAGYEVGDIIIINTIRGQRSISLTKPANITATPTEFTLPQGYNQDDCVFYGPGIWRCKTTQLIGGTNSNTVPGVNDDYWEFVSTSVMANLTPASQWLELHSVDNVMQVYLGNNPSNIVAGIKYLKYTPAYWGV